MPGPSDGPPTTPPRPLPTPHQEEGDRIDQAHAAAHAPFGCPYLDDDRDSCSLYRAARAQNLDLKEN